MTRIGRARARAMVVMGVVLALAAPARAVGVESWQASTTEAFARGTLDGTAVDREGRVVLAPRVDEVWGPAEGIVWSVLPVGDRAALVALSSPGRLLQVAAGEDPVTWFEAEGETLVTALAGDGEGGAWFGLSPEGRVLHALRAGESDVELDTGALFVWALARDPTGALWIGTAVPGTLQRYDGTETKRLFESGDDPVRAIVPYGDGVLLGTGGRGRVVRVDRQGEAFVLLDADEEEIVSLAVAADGTIFALAAAGSRQVGTASSPQAGVAAQVGEVVRVVASAPDGDGDQDEAPSSRNRQAGSRPAQRFQAAPGGALYRLDPDGGQRKIWEAGTEIPFAVALADAGGQAVLVATGDDGRLHSIDRDGRAARLLRIPSDQASAMSAEGPGRVLVGGTTDARVVRLGFEAARRGSYLTPAIDAGTVADWGVVEWSAALPRGSGLSLHARAGNSDEPDETWTTWRKIGDGADGSAAPSSLPATRWLQLRADLAGGGADASPRVDRLEVHYRPRNRAPAVNELSVEMPGVAWTPGPAPATRQGVPAVSDDPVTRRAARKLEGRGRVQSIRKVWEAGVRTFHWSAEDPDDDELVYRLELQPSGGTVWIPLAGDLEDSFYSWDARGVPDGRYRVRLTADDAPDNPRGDRLTGSRVSDLFVVDNSRPSIEGHEIRRADDGWRLEFTAVDPGGRVAAVEVALDGGDWRPVDPEDGVADSERETYRVTLPAGEGAGEASQRPVLVRVTDAAGNLGGALWTLGGS